MENFNFKKKLFLFSISAWNRTRMLQHKNTKRTARKPVFFVTYINLHARRWIIHGFRIYNNCAGIMRLWASSREKGQQMMANLDSREAAGGQQMVKTVLVGGAKWLIWGFYRWSFCPQHGAAVGGAASVGAYRSVISSANAICYSLLSPADLQLSYIQELERKAGRAKDVTMQIASLQSGSEFLYRVSDEFLTFRGRKLMSLNGIKHCAASSLHSHIFCALCSTCPVLALH